MVNYQKNGKKYVVRSTFLVRGHQSPGEAEGEPVAEKTRLVHKTKIKEILIIHHYFNLKTFQWHPKTVSLFYNFFRLFVPMEHRLPTVLLQNKHY